MAQKWRNSGVLVHQSESDINLRLTDPLQTGIKLGTAEI